MKSASAEQIQTLDKIAIEKFNISSLLLMENAGRIVAMEAVKTLKQNRGSKINVVCGKGNNGGDGFVCSRYLIEKNIPVEVFLIGKKDQLSKDAVVNYNLISEKQKIIELVDLGALEKFKPKLDNCDVLVDAIFGIGLKGALEEPFLSLIQYLNSSGKPIVSVDAPSGLDATFGNVLGTCIKAVKTVTFSLAKSGFFINQGPLYCGEIIVADIGVPKELIDSYAR